MVNRKIIITRETDNVVISININSNYKYFKRSWKIYGIISCHQLHPYIMMMSTTQGSTCVHIELLII